MKKYSLIVEILFITAVLVIIGIDLVGGRFSISLDLGWICAILWCFQSMCNRINHG